MDIKRLIDDWMTGQRA